jgi:hypothetical protein
MRKYILVVVMFMLAACSLGQIMVKLTSSSTPAP